VARTKDSYKIIRPELIPFTSYPYEWAFSQLKDAALLTLDIQLTALKHGMSLKDASAYNIQFLRGKPIFVDTLSFEKQIPDYPWVAYRQFCQHFLCPLALMSFVDVGFNQLFRIHIDGIPIQLASKLLPFSTRLRWSLLAHVHLHASIQQKHADNNTAKVKRKVSETGITGIVFSLKNAIDKLKIKKQKTEWDRYYENTNYSTTSSDHKAAIVKDCLGIVRPKTLWDLGANTGRYSRIASHMGIFTVSFDLDPNAVEHNYLTSRANDESNILPLLMDFTNPSSAIGWSSSERMSLKERGPVDAILALALIHHLAISNNVPLGNIAEYFSELGSTLIIEFVPKQDSQVIRLLTSREDVFSKYDQVGFESEFQKHYKIKGRFPVQETERTIYLMESIV